MKIITPATINDAALTSSNVPESDAPAWVSGTTYAAKYVVMRAVSGVHRRFERIVAGAGTVPPESDPANWLDIGPTNRWAMFDEQNGTQTSNATSIVVEITVSDVITGVGLFNVVGSSVRVERVVPGYGTVYDKTISLADFSYIYDWWTFWFSPITSLKDVVFTDLPPYGGGVTRITISAPSSTAKCGSVVLGNLLELGTSVEGTSYEYNDYSVISEDDFGVYKITRRSIAKRLALQAMIPASSANAAYATLNAVSSRPTVVIGNSDIQGTIVYGLIGRPKFTHSNPAMVELSLDVKGLI